MIEGFAKSLRAGTTTRQSLVAQLGPKLADEIQALHNTQVAELNPLDLTTAQFAAKQAAEKRAFYKQRAASGHRAYRATRQDHSIIAASIFESVNAGIKPAVPIILRAYGEVQKRPPEWAMRVATQKRPKRMGETLKAYNGHAVIQELRDGRMLTQTHKSALQNSTYSGLAELLFSGSQSTRERRAMKQKIGALEARVSAVEAEVVRAHTRMDVSEQWKNDAASLYRDGKSYGCIAVAVGRSKSTVHKLIETLIAAEKLAARPSRQRQ
jgi:hypothetical protein